MAELETITRKNEVQKVVDKITQETDVENIHQLAEMVEQQLLVRKVKFPLLEYATELLTEFIPNEKQGQFCLILAKQHTIGGNVVIGKLLQQTIATHFEEHIDTACTCISEGAVWYSADLIGERVIGHSLLVQPTITLEKMRSLKHSQNQWIVRSLGAGSHYAIKKGLDRAWADHLFQLLLSLAQRKEKHIKTGIGWAAKTTAKFHPEIIKNYSEQIANTEYTGQWFRTKIAIGLKRHTHAQGN